MELYCCLEKVVPQNVMPCVEKVIQDEILNQLFKINDMNILEQAITKKKRSKHIILTGNLGKNDLETTKEVNLLLALVLKLRLPIRSASGGSVPRAWQQREAAGTARGPQQWRRRGPACWRLSPQRRGLTAQELPRGAARAATHPQTLHRPPEDRR